MRNTRPVLRPSASETFTLRKPSDWDNLKTNSRLNERSSSPTPRGRSEVPGTFNENDIELEKHLDSITIRRQRPRKQPPSFQMLAGSLKLLSPTAEERLQGNSQLQAQVNLAEEASLSKTNLAIRKDNERSSLSSKHSKRARKGESAETSSSHSKLRKLRPPQNKKEVQGSISKNHLDSPKRAPRFDDNESFIDVLHDLRPPDEREYARRLTDAISSLTNQQEVIPVSLQGVHIANDYVIPSQILPDSKKRSGPLEGIVSERIARLIESEPTHPPRSLGSSRRMVSKSLPSTSKLLSDRSRSKDPLLAVSAEDDMASLLFLAQAIKNENTRVSSHVYAETIPTHSKIPSQVTASPDGLLRAGLFESKRWIENKTDSTKSSVIQSKPSSELKCISQNSPHHPLIDNGQATAAIVKGSQLDVFLADSRLAALTPSKTLVNASPVRHFPSPARSVKAIAAKFDAAERAGALNIGTTSSPSKTVLRGVLSSKGDRDTVVARYTINDASPVRSLRSVVSGKSLQSTQHSPSDIRNTSKKYTHDDTTTNSATVESNQIVPLDTGSSVPVLSIATSRQLSSPIKSITDSCTLRTPVPPFVAQENIARTFDGHASLESLRHGTSRKGSFSSMSSLIRATKVVTTQNYLDKTDPLSKTSLTDPSSKTSHVRFAMDGVDLNNKNGNGNPHVSDELHHVAIADNLTSFNRVIQDSSLLHAQIREMQRQLTSRQDKIKHLQQQLDARSNLEIGTLSDELVEARSQIMTWKNRAEIAEKQVEVLTGESVGRSLSISVRKKGNHGVKSDTDSYGSTNAMLPLRTAVNSHGMDGTEGFYCDWQDSEETTGTVVRDLANNGHFRGSDHQN